MFIERCELTVLSQGYDAGWVAYAINQNDQLSNFKLQTFARTAFPWWFGRKLEHVKVNGWGNGWLLPTVDDQQTANNKQQIVILFWPQYLEWGGLVLLLATFVWLGVSVRRSGGGS